MVPQHNQSITYRPEVDGLRALAVLPVIFFHAGFEWMSGGFVGVDIFFVISGYLITAILYNEIQAGTFTLGRFYERRIRRLYPALTLVTFICIPFAWLLMLPSDFQQFLHSVAAIQVFASNFLFWSQMDYFSNAAELTPLLHTWSLAVEEQFYVIFPLLLLALKPVRKHALILLIGAGLIASLLLAELWSTRYEDANFFLLPTRAWELLTGSLLALTVHRISSVPRAFAEVLSWSGIALIVIANVAFHGGTPFPGFLALLPVGGTALVIAFAQRGTTVARVLSLKPMIFIGLVSYSAYLWHQPLFAFARIRFPDTLTSGNYVGLIAVTFILAYLSWRFVENPFRERRRFPRSKLFKGAVVSSGLLFVSAVSASMYYQPLQMWEKRLADEQLKALEMVEAARERPPAKSTGECIFWATELDDPTRERLMNCRQTYGRGTAVIGDSHGRNVYNGLALSGKSEFIFGFTRAGCMPLPDRDWCQYEEFQDFVERQPDVFAHVVYNQAGFFMMQTPRGREVTRTHLSENRSHLFDPNDEYIDGVVDYLTGLSRHLRVTWLGPWTEPHILPRQYVYSGCNNAPPMNRNVVQSFAQLDDQIAAVVRSVDTVDYLSSDALFGTRSGSKLIDCHNIYFHDGDHWSLAGERRFGKVLKQELGKILSQNDE